MALYDANDFYSRLHVTFPKRWAGSAAFAPPTGTNTQDAGRMYALLHSIAQYGFAYMMTIWAYVRLQTRIATATDTNLDTAVRDFYGTRLPRLANEQDPTYYQRFKAKINSLTGCYNAVQSAVATYFQQNPDPTLSGFIVFDTQSDPPRAAYYGIVPGEFGIVLYAASPPQPKGWRVGYSSLGQSTVLDGQPLFSKSFTSSYPGLQQAVNDVKDFCYMPVFVTVRYEPANLN